MKHKHYDMIVAKAENMNLVVFIRANRNAGWVELEADEFPVVEDFDYFLCLPQHNEDGQCLHWLNGGEVQLMHPSASEWSLLVSHEADPKWYPDLDFMGGDFSIRIKPKKEKRWIATFPWCGNVFYVTPKSFPSKDLLNDYVDMHYGKRELMLTHEIEVEV